MNGKLRVLSTLTGLAIVVSACSGGGSTAPGSQAASQPPAASQPGASGPAASGGGASAAPLSGSLTIWEAYGASGTSKNHRVPSGTPQSLYRP